MAIPAPAIPRPDHKPDHVFTRADIGGDTVLGCDVVIVGSGAGGATLAAELAEGGIDVIVLEEGRFFTSSDFTTDATAAARAMYRDGGATMALGNPPVLFQEGATVGGSSVLNGGMSWRTPERILERWQLEDGIDGIGPKAMEPFFDRVERRIHVSYQDPGTVGRDNQLLKEGADALGWDIINNRRNTLHCAGSNNCAFGCPTKAKQSTLVTYIPRALHFGARLYSDLRVTNIIRHGKRATGVQARVVNSNKTLGARVTVRAKLVVSACGSIQTPALLMRSGFHSPSSMIGRNLSLHPNCKLVAIFDEEVRGWEGTHQAYQVRQFRDEGFLFAAVNIPPSVLGMVMPQHGGELGDLMKDYRRMVIAGMLVEDTNTGRVWAGPKGSAITTYQLNDYDADRLKRGAALLSELLFEVGAKRILLPFEGQFHRGDGARPGELRSPDDLPNIFSQRVRKSSMEVVTVHLMGTARMGGDRVRAVTDSYGLVHDAAGLAICDASLFPSPIGVNPCETIQALATRNAAHILDNQRRYLS